LASRGPARAEPGRPRLPSQDERNDRRREVLGMAKAKYERTKPHVNVGTIGHIDTGRRR
jgi:GTPase